MKIRLNWNNNIWLALFFFIGISLILAVRVLYTAWDDSNYIAYFAHGSPAVFTYWWDYFLSEPLWSLYTSLMGSIFDPINAFRITIFLSSFMFLIASKKLTRGAWVFVFLAFVFDHFLSTQMYFNQIRQGFALSVFLMMLAQGMSPLLGAVAASLIHTSFISVIPCVIFAGIKRINLGWLAVGTAIGVYFLKGIIGDIDFGRRNGYMLGTTLNIFYYLYNIFPYFITLYLLKDSNSEQDEQQVFWFRFTFLYVILAFLLTFVHQAASRLNYFQGAFLMILIGLNIKGRRGKICAIMWLILLVITLVLEGSKVGIEDSWYGRWGLILNGK